MPGISAEHAEHAGGDRERARRAEHLAASICAADVAARLPTRDTTIAAATEISSAGICATRPSPIVSSDVAVGRLAGVEAVLQRRR